MKLSALFPGLWDERGKEIRSTCSLKSQYQPCGYVPVQASDDGKSAMTSCGTAATPQWDGSLCRCFERSLLTGKRRQLPFLPRPWPEYYDTQYRLPTRQMGWPTLGCNQQDPRNASERLGNGKPTRMVPMVAGGRAANTAHHPHSDCRQRRSGAAQLSAAPPPLALDDTVRRVRCKLR